MAELLLFADVEQAVIDELGENVSTGVPAEPKPAAFTRVTASGGTPLNMVTDRYTVTVEAFGLTETAARARMAAQVAALEAAGRDGRLGSETCYGVRALSVPSNVPMASVPTHERYIATLAADVRRR